MKQIAIILGTLLVVHLLAALGLVAWLGATERLSEERVERVVDIFRPTLEQERQQEKEAAEAEKQAREQAERLAWLESASDGPLTIADRLRAERQASELRMQRTQKLQAEIAQLKDHLERVKGEIAQQKKQLEQERESFEAYRERERQLRRDENFQQAVRLYEQLKADQAKQMLLNLIRESQAKAAQASQEESESRRQALEAESEQQMERVIDYFAAMQQRKAAAILEEFETEQELLLATQIIEKLRRRGLDVESPRTAASPASADDV